MKLLELIDELKPLFQGLLHYNLDHDIDTCEWRGMVEAVRRYCREYLSEAGKPLLAPATVAKLYAIDRRLEDAQVIFARLIAQQVNEECRVQIKRLADFQMRFPNNGKVSLRAAARRRVPALLKTCHNLPHGERFYEITGLDWTNGMLVLEYGDQTVLQKGRSVSLNFKGSIRVTVPEIESIIVPFTNNPQGLNFEGDKVQE